MPLQNRVTPSGEIVADPARGLLMGNRGILHDDARRLGKARWRHKNWIICLLEFRGRRRTVMTPGHYTELFFLDEAVALAAGHRPCAECRRDRYREYRSAFVAGARNGGAAPKAAELDAMLHAARVVPRHGRQAIHQANMPDLPDGTFIRLSVDDSPRLILGDKLLAWTPAGYGGAVGRQANGAVTVLTPRPSVAALLAGFIPELHPSAKAG